MGIRGWACIQRSEELFNIFPMARVIICNHYSCGNVFCELRPGSQHGICSTLSSSHSFIPHLMLNLVKQVKDLKVHSSA